MTLFGAGVVLLIGLIGRAVAGDRAGLIAAGVAAVYPNLWINDGLVMSETLATLAVALAHPPHLPVHPRPRVDRGWVGVRAGWRCWRPSRPAAAAHGAPGRVVPEQFRWQAPARPRASSGFAAFVVTSPWLVANLTRFDEPVLFSTNDGLTLCGANLDRTYYGEGIGLWALDCAGFPVPKGDRSVVSNVLRSDGLRFIRDHLGRLPVVVAVRVGAVWSLYAPGLMANYNVNEGRPVEVVVARVRRRSGYSCRSRCRWGACSVGGTCRSRRWSRSS